MCLSSENFLDLLKNAAIFTWDNNHLQKILLLQQGIVTNKPISSHMVDSLQMIILSQINSTYDVDEIFFIKRDEEFEFEGKYYFSY